MSAIRFWSLALVLCLCSSPLPAADPARPSSEAVPELRGVLVAGRTRQFSLVAPGRGTSAWVKIGQDFAGWELSDFKVAEESLVLKKDGRTVVVKLSDSAIAAGALTATKATLADAEEVFRKMDFDRMMSRIVDQQKTSMAAMTRQMAGGAPGGDVAAREAFQKKMTDAMFDAMDLPGMKNDMVKAYSEIFSKDELHALSDFYGTPAGQAMVDKQPEISKRMNDLMLPRMMAAMPKIQEMGKQFAMEQAAKAKAAASSTAPAGAAAAAPVTPAK